MGDDEILIRPDGTIDATLDPGYQAEYADYLREIGREDLIVESAEELTVEMGGPGPGPRQGHKSSRHPTA